MASKRRDPSGCPAVDRAVAYARDIAARKIAAGRLAQLSCERFLNDLDAARDGTNRWAFTPLKAEKAIRFAALLPNIKGPMAGKPLALMPWQELIFANIFGFVGRDDQRRRFRQATVWLPRGSGKTSMAAPLALYLTFLDHEGGAEGYAAAVTREQARILFDVTLNMVKRTPRLRARYGIEPHANAIAQESSASRFVPVSSDAKSLDGLNVQMAVCDEIGSHRTSEVYDILLTALGKRAQPLLLSISTATGNSSGIGKQLWDYAERVVKGQQDDDRLYSLIYAADETDDPWDEATWIKANPGWGITVQPDAVRAIMRQARNNPAQEAAAMTRHLNRWIGADEALFSMRGWRACANAELSIDMLEGAPCDIGIDLASKTDLAAMVIVFPRTEANGKLHYDVFSRCYLNEAAVQEARNASYPGWAEAGYLRVTPGNETDFAAIETDLLALCGRFQVRSVAFDPWAATQFAQRMMGDGVPMVEFRQNTGNYSEPTKELDAAIRSGRIHHDGDPLLEWCVGNVVGHYDANTNVYPRKSRPEQKIDAALAMIMAIARNTAPAQQATSVYESRGLVSF